MHKAKQTAETLKLSELRITRTKEVDMSSEAIAARLEELEQLYQLSMSLLQANHLGSVEEVRAKKNL